MSGGSGTRLWPLSTQERPKQFHRLGGRRTMIEETLQRFTGDHGGVRFLDPVIIANAAHGDLVQSLAAQAGVNLAALILEPEGRNTAATAALAAMIAQEIDPEALVLIAPADHLVSRPRDFVAAITAAAPIARERIVTFGIKPSGPETGYGYIQRGGALADGVFAVAAFKEKPKLPLAEEYFGDPRYSWNSGVFFAAPAVLLEEFGIAAADIRDGAQEALARGSRSANVIHLDAHTFGKVRAEAVDRAVMEKTRRAAVAPCDIGWADIGSWSELWRLSAKDAGGNAAEGPVTLVDSGNTLVRSDGIQVSAIGVTDLVIVASGNSVLVMHKDKAQDVKKVIPGQD
jgi:mannose-1-phosphate guanylyltransferase/mannose-6-phosphate isomerase